MDRLWRHPSELASPGASPGASPARPGPSRVRPARSWLLVLGAACVGAATALVVLAVTGTLGTHDRVVTRTVRTGEQAARVAAIVAPSLVAVRASTDGTNRDGSGLCIRSGYVLTSSALVGAAASVQVTAADGVARTAAVVGRDPLTDVAVLRSGPMGTATTAPTRAGTRPGDTIVEVARPGRDRWVGVGVVSALGRSATSSSGDVMTGLIETDAGRAPAGAAAVDAKGNVVGMATAYTRDDGSSFVVPIAAAVRVLDDLVATGRASHGWLGVSVVDGSAGATVDHLANGSPATGALRPGDVITAVDATTVDDMMSLLQAIRDHRAHDTVHISVRRGDERRSVTVELGDYATARGAGS